MKSECEDHFPISRKDLHIPLNSFKHQPHFEYEQCKQILHPSL